jgi:hypothetical protein
MSVKVGEPLSRREFSEDATRCPLSLVLTNPLVKNILHAMPTIVAAVRSAHAAQQRVQALLAAAQRAVEIAIGDSEAAALSHFKIQQSNLPL